uniref:Uncharacterized protein n=1 Tax=Opuntia streptacantha TaxID=393608 RepID=A0A7C8ZB03_OPUST
MYIFVYAYVCMYVCMCVCACVRACVCVSEQIANKLATRGAEGGDCLVACIILFRVQPRSPQAGRVSNHSKIGKEIFLVRRRNFCQNIGPLLISGHVRQLQYSFQNFSIVK